MNQFQSELDKARKEAQALHKKISDDIDKAQDATITDVKQAQTNVKTLADNMKVLVTEQTDAAMTNINSAIDKMEAAAKADVAETTDDIRHANEALLDSVRKATQSLSQAVAEMRTKVADKIAPKTK